MRYRLNVNNLYPSRHKRVVHWQATSLLLLFMQQPWAVAGCMKILVIDKHVPNISSMRSFYETDMVSLFWVMCLTLLWGLIRSLYGRTLCFVASVFSLHEQRTGWSSRLGTERRWRAGGLFTIITRSRVTSRDWQRPRPIGEPLSHQQHAIFGKWLHHRGTTVACGGRDFRRDFQFVVQKQDNE